MPAGSAWAKSYRTCKSCIGSEFCRFGLGDSMGLARKVEKRFRGIDSPGKLKLATAGCPRNCSEALIKDVGAVAIGDGKWEIYVAVPAARTCAKAISSASWTAKRTYCSTPAASCSTTARTPSTRNEPILLSSASGSSASARGDGGQRRPGQVARRRHAGLDRRGLRSLKEAEAPKTANQFVSLIRRRVRDMTTGSWSATLRKYRGAKAGRLRWPASASRCFTPIQARFCHPGRMSAPARAARRRLDGRSDVICPLHERAYDLRTGQGLNGECTSLRVYPISLGTDGKIWLQIPG